MSNMQYSCIDKQLEELISILKKNHPLMEMLEYIAELRLPNFYIAAGCVFQTVWNYQDGRDLNYEVKDLDVIYYNPENLSIDTDMKYYEMIQEYARSHSIPYEVDVSNEARMHLWKEKKESEKVLPYQNSEDAIGRWIATVHAIGITIEDGNIKVYAPYGLSDIFSRTIRPIKHSGNSKELYNKKVTGWQNRFSKLTVVEW